MHMQKAFEMDDLLFLLIINERTWKSLVNVIISIPGAKNNFMLGCQKIITNGSFQNEALKLQYELSWRVQMKLSNILLWLISSFSCAFITFTGITC